jgi:hypothetical protein
VRERERTARVLAWASLAIASCAVLHDLLAIALDRLDLIPRLLSPSGLDVIVALLSALVLFALRLSLLTLGPAILLALLGAWLFTLLARSGHFSTKRSQLDAR